MSALKRLIIHLVIWAIIAPWVAASVWFWTGGMSYAPSGDPLARIVQLPIVIVFGLFGIPFCAIVSVPTAFVVASILSTYPKVINVARFRYLLVAAISLLGFGCSAYVATSASGTSKYILLLIGTLTGFATAKCTINLWCRRAY